MIITPYFFYLAFDPHSFILLFFLAFYQIDFFFQFHHLILKYYFSFYYILISDLTIFLLIMNFSHEFFCEMFILFYFTLEIMNVIYPLVFLFSILSLFFYSTIVLGLLSNWFFFSFSSSDIEILFFILFYFGFKFNLFSFDLIWFSSVKCLFFKFHP